MTKKFFIESIEKLKNYTELANKLYDLGVDIDGIAEVNELVTRYICLLEMSTKCYVDLKDREYPSEIEYFVYDLDFGKNWYEGFLTEDGEKIKLSTAEDLWDCLVKKNPEIKDPETDGK